MPHFTQDWFSTHIESWRWIFQTIGWNADEPKTIVEVGSFEGRSTIWSLQNLLHHPSSTIYCIDTFQGSVEHEAGGSHEAGAIDVLFDRFMANLGETPGRQKARVMRQPSQRALISLAAEGVRADFVYIDGSHAAADVLFDCVLAFQILRVGGVMICDDYLWQMEALGSEDVLNSPKIAIDAFTNIYRRKMRVVWGQKLQQLAIRKLFD